MRQRDLLMPAQWADNGCMNDRPRALHLKACRFGVTVLKVFWWATLVAVIALAAALAAVIAGLWPIGPWLGCTAVVAAVETIVFWTGIVTVYLSSVQLGLKWRVIGVLCGWIPIANLIALRRIIRIVERGWSRRRTASSHSTSPIRWSPGSTDPTTGWWRATRFRGENGSSGWSRPDDAAFRMRT